MNIAYSKKELYRDNIALYADLEKCYASNTELVIIKETTDMHIAHNALRDKYKRVRARLTTVMNQYHITFNEETNCYEQTDD